MINNPLVSVLMTVYNREKYIAEAIESVIASTYQNWELIIVDDQSKDRSVEIAHSYEAKDDRIKVYINEKNLGDYPNRNKASSYAKGKYLKYLDADDLIYPHCLNVMVETMERYPEAGLALSIVEQENSKPYPILLSPQQAFERHYFNTPVFHKSPLGAIIKKKTFEKIHGFTGKQHVGDYEFWHNLAANEPIVLMTGGLAWYRNHDQQQMNDNRNNPLVPFKYFIISIEQLKNQECPLNNEKRNLALKKIEKKISGYIFSYAKRLNFNDVLEMKRLANMSWTKIISSAIH